MTADGFLRTTSPPLLVRMAFTFFFPPFSLSCKIFLEKGGGTLVSPPPSPFPSVESPALFSPEEDKRSFHEMVDVSLPAPLPSPI